jgi:hypothetical protein
MKCIHDNWAEDCDELCSSCGHECRQHNVSSHIPCFEQGCNCKEFDYNDEFDRDYSQDEEISDEYISELIAKGIK